MGEGFWVFGSEQDAESAIRVIRMALDAVGCRAVDLAREVTLVPGEAPLFKYPKERLAPVQRLGYQYVCGTGGVVTLSRSHEAQTETEPEHWIVRLRA